MKISGIFRELIPVKLLEKNCPYLKESRSIIAIMKEKMIIEEIIELQEEEMMAVQDIPAEAIQEETKEGEVLVQETLEAIEITEDIKSLQLG